MSLTRKLVLSFIAVSVVGALLAIGLARWMTIEEFDRLMIEQGQQVFVEQAASYYTNNGSWQGVALHFRQSPRPSYLKQSRQSNGKTPQQPTFAFTLVDQNGKVIIPGGPYKMRMHLPDEVINQGEPVEVEGERVGTVIASGEPPQLSPQEERYLARTNQALIYSAGGAALVALILGIVLARGLTGPVRALTEAIRMMAQGELGQQVPVRSQDEIGELTSAFNQMSSDLKNLVNQRKQMTADIAHELRTPLTVISGYVESMQDGVLETTPDRLETIHKEVTQLQRLVEDLRTLSLAETGQLSLNPNQVSVKDLLVQVETAYRLTAEQKGIRLVQMVSENLPGILIDSDRMMQVLSNLVGNALRHTPVGGSVYLEAAAGDEPPTVPTVLTVVSRQSTVDNGKKWVWIRIRDTGEGIAPEVLTHIFDRFYRGEQARPERDGETGLGLSIARSIIEMSGGELWAESDGLGKGSTFTILLESA